MTNDNATDHLLRFEQDNIALMKRWFDDVWNNRCIETIHELLSPDVVSHYEHTEIKGVNNWKEQFYEVLVKAIPDIRFVIEDIIANGDYVVTRWQARGVHRGVLLGVSPSGKMIEFNGMSWTKIVDGKVVENWSNWNMSYLFRQLLSEVKALRGILPFCSYCKKIRDDKGYWEQVDVYIHRHSEAGISHGICPECAQEQFPEEYAKLAQSEKDKN